MPAERIALETLLCDTHSPDSALARLAERIEAGSIFVYPTETIYGIGGCMRDAVEQKIIAAKKRRPDSPMILIASSQEAFAALGIRLNALATMLAEKFWPGNLTMVVATGQEHTTAAIRVSAHPFLQALGKHYNSPVYSTSANISSEPYNSDPDTIYRLFSNNVDFMVDAGMLPPSPPSTVVEILDSDIKILREGAIAAQELVALVNR